MKEEKTQEQAQAILEPIVRPTETKEYLLSTIGQEVKAFELLQRQAMVYCNSTIVPQAYQGQKNLGNVIIGLDMAKRMKVNPLMVFQNLYVVHGNPAWSSKFLIATFNMCGRFAPISYIEIGKKGTDEWGMKAITASKETGEKIEGPSITIGLAKKEGWYGKPGSKWQSIPELMLRYRSAAWLINTTAPEISMGIATAEEVEDLQQTVVDAEFEDVTSQPVRKVVFSEHEPQQQQENEQSDANVQTNASEPQKRGKKSAEDLFGNPTE